MLSIGNIMFVNDIGENLPYLAVNAKRYAIIITMLMDIEDF